MRRLARCSARKEVKPYGASGRCVACYDKIRIRRPRPVRLCIECGEMKPHEAHGMCKACYRRSRPRRLRPTITCVVCKQKKSNQGGGLCGACYARCHPQQKRGACRECKGDSSQDGHLCRACWREGHSRKKVTCASCGKRAWRAGRGLCSVCYGERYNAASRILAGKLPQEKLRGHLSPNWRGGKFVNCVICGDAVGWRGPWDLRHNKTGFHCKNKAKHARMRKGRRNKESTDEEQRCRGVQSCVA